MQKQYTSIFFYGTIALLIIIVLAVTLGKSNKQHNDDTITIGALLCMTGSCAESGENSLDGIELAVHEINEQGGLLGKQLEVVLSDTDEDIASKSVSAYRSLMLEKPDYIVGPTWSAAGESIAPIVKDEQVLITSPSLGITDFKNTNDNMFNTWMADEIGTRELARFAYEDLGWRTAAVMSAKQVWVLLQGNIFIQEFERLGGEIVFYSESLPGEKDFKTETAEVKQLNPDGVMLANTIDMDTVSRELRRVGYQGQFLAPLMDQTRLDNAAGALDGTIYSQQPSAGPDFTESFESFYGYEPGITSDTAYDAVMLYAQAVREASTKDFHQVKHAMNAIKEFDAATGPVTFDENGGVIKEVVFWQVQNGESVKY